MPANVPYLVGSTLGRDHQMWPMVLQSQLVNYGFTPSDYARYWAKDITLGQILALYWRVRKWTLSGSCDVSETVIPFGVDPPISMFGTAAISTTLETYKGSGTGPATIEAQLLNGVGTLTPPSSGFKYLANSRPTFFPTGQSVSTWSITGYVTLSGVISEGESYVGVGVCAFATPFLIPLVFDPVTHLFTPTWLIGVGALPLIANNSFQGMYAMAMPARNPLTATSGTGTANLLSPGSLIVNTGIAPSFTVPLQLIWRFYGQGISDQFSGSGSLTLTMQATEFWPYTNTLGQPIYDTVTGSPTGFNPLA